MKKVLLIVAILTLICCFLQIDGYCADNTKKPGEATLLKSPAYSVVVIQDGKRMPHGWVIVAQGNNNSSLKNANIEGLKILKKDPQADITIVLFQPAGWTPTVGTLPTTKKK